MQPTGDGKPDFIAAPAAGLGSLLMALPDPAALFWGAVGGYVGMARGETGSLRSNISTLLTSALISAALTSLTASVVQPYLPNAAVVTVKTAVSFFLGWGFFKVADPLLQMGLEALRSIFTRWTGTGTPQPSNRGDKTP